MIFKTVFRINAPIFFVRVCVCVCSALVCARVCMFAVRGVAQILNTIKE